MNRDYEVKTKASIVSKIDKVDNFSLDSFSNANSAISEAIDINQSSSSNKGEQKQQIIIQENQEIIELKNQISQLTNMISNINNSIENLKQQSFSTKDLDAQIVKALKELDQVSTFYKQAMLSFEQKLLKTSFTIAKKIINIEVSQNSADIARATIDNLMNKLSNASKTTIHLNPKDYLILKNEFNNNDIVSVVEDNNITPGGVVIVSDVGNFDGSVDTKIDSIFETLELIS